MGTYLSPRTIQYLGDIQKLCLGFKTLGMTSEGLKEIFDLEDMCGNKCPPMSMGGRATPTRVHRRGAWTPIGMRGNLKSKIKKSFVMSWVWLIKKLLNMYTCQSK